MRIGFLLLAMALTACAGPPAMMPDADSAGAPTPSTITTGGFSASGGEPVRCDAKANQTLVGQNVGAVTFPENSEVRVVCSTCAATEDHRPNRLNVRYNQDTGVIEKVDCG